MPLPALATIIDGYLDPTDVNDITLDFWSNDATISVLQSGETIASYVLTLESEAVALGVEIGTSSYASDSINADTAIKVWLSVASGYINNAAFDNNGTTVGLRAKITTTNAPPRVFERTFGVTFAQQ